MTLMAVDQIRIHNIFMNIYQISLASPVFMVSILYDYMDENDIPQITFLESNIDTPKADMK